MLRQLKGRILPPEVCIIGNRYQWYNKKVILPHRMAYNLFVITCDVRG